MGAQARRTTARMRQKPGAGAGPPAGHFCLAPPVPAGNGLAFPEFAAALRALQLAKQQALRHEASRHGGIASHQRALPEMEDDAFGDGANYDDDGGKNLLLAQWQRVP